MLQFYKMCKVFGRNENRWSEQQSECEGRSFETHEPFTDNFRFEDGIHRKSNRPRFEAEENNEAESAVQ